MLNQRSLSQKGKEKYSNRYPLSGKIKCGCCGSSYVARYKIRKNGSCYKAWRCNEAAKHGKPHTDKAGNKVGCTGMSLRNEDAIHIMYLVTGSLKYNKKKMTGDLLSIIKSVIASDLSYSRKACPKGVSMDNVGTDSEELKSQIRAIGEKRTKLIDLYTSGDITREEFTAARAKCENEITKLQSVIESMPRYPGKCSSGMFAQNEKQRERSAKQKELVDEIAEVIQELVNGVEYEDDFYKEILNKMVVNDKDHIDVHLQFLPFKWSYTIAK
ncbi:hypothetical protein C806_01532 [Lachnospiraceae bacterium 3-1]|nr:hypothetical protein C806_01532 [Lachnospiraceae bacterium 3-1]